MKSAPLSLDLSYPTLIHVVSDPEGSCNAGYDVECDVQVWQSANNERKWRVQLGVKFKAKGATVAAHCGEVTYVGLFTVVEDFPLEKMYRLIGVDAPSILYSSIRELLALLTGRSSNKTVLLPTVSFIENVVVPVSQSAAAPSGENRVPKKLRSKGPKKIKTAHSRPRSRTG